MGGRPRAALLLPADGQPDVGERARALEERGPLALQEPVEERADVRLLRGERARRRRRADQLRLRLVERVAARSQLGQQVDEVAEGEVLGADEVDAVVRSAKAAPESGDRPFPREALAADREEERPREPLLRD